MTRNKDSSIDIFVDEKSWHYSYRGFPCEKITGRIKIFDLAIHDHMTNWSNTIIDSFIALLPPANEVVGR